jgi:hypothetical protein
MAATHALFGSPKAHEMKERDTVEASECGDADATTGEKWRIGYLSWG